MLIVPMLIGGIIGFFIAGLYGLVLGAVLGVIIRKAIFTNLWM